MPRAVARALDVPEQPGRPPLAALVEALRPKRLLLVLDNCEHLLDACARLAEALLRAGPSVRLLATSRVALGVAAETVWPVPPLALPPAPGPHAAAPLPPEPLLEYAAVRLFVERARAVLPTFEMTPRDAPAVAELCRRLDGLPLALELAAAWVRVLPAPQLLARLEDRFRLLTGGRRAAPERHRTLRAAVDWSHALLPEPERRLFARLSVFAGGWTLEAAEAVCADARRAPGGLPPGAVLGLLARLVDASLVVAEGEADGTARFRLLETLREYGREQLAAGGEAEALGARHARHYTAVAVAAEPWLAGREQVAWLGRLDREADNLRAALRWLEGHGAHDGALRLAAALQVWWLTHGSRVEGLAWLERLLAAPAAAGATPARLGALDAAGLLAWLMGKADQAWAYPEEALRLARAAGDRRAEGRAHYGLGRAATSDRRRAPAAGEAHLRRSLAIGRELADPPLVGWSLYFLGTAALRRGDLAAARALREEGCAVWRPTGDRFGYGNALNALAKVALAQGDLDTARALWEERLGLAEELGGPVAAAQALEGLAAVAAAHGDHPTARRLLARGLRARSPLSAPHNTAPSLAAFARLAAARGRYARAARLAGAVEATARSSASLTDLDLADERQLASSLQAARRALGEAAYLRAHAEGRAMALEQAVAYALEDEDAPPA